MSSWLKWRLCALLSLLALSGSGAYLRAQNAFPAPAKTPEEAGAMFYQMLANIATNDRPERGGPRDLGPERFIGALSRTQVQGLIAGKRANGFDDLLLILAKEREEPQFDAQIKSTRNGQSLVEVSPSTRTGHEVVVIAEDGGFRVDVKATYGRWNNVSGLALDKEWYRFTGVESPALKQDVGFLENARRSACQSRLKLQMLGVFQYAQDYDEKLPTGRRWMDVLQPYVRSEEIFHCPALQTTGNGYAYNSQLTRINQGSIDVPALTINIYETSNPARNVFAPFTGKAYRHRGGQNLAFADGHIKWFRRGTEVSSGGRIKP